MTRKVEDRLDDFDARCKQLAADCWEIARRGPVGSRLDADRGEQAVMRAVSCCVFPEKQAVSKSERRCSEALALLKEAVSRVRKLRAAITSVTSDPQCPAWVKAKFKSISGVNSVGLYIPQPENKNHEQKENASDDAEDA